MQELQLGMIWGEVEHSLLTRARAVIPQLELEMMREALVGLVFFYRLWNILTHVS